MSFQEQKPVETSAVYDEETGQWVFYRRSGTVLDKFEIHVDICNPAAPIGLDCVIKKASFAPPYAMGDSLPEIMIFKLLLSEVGTGVPPELYMPPVDVLDPECTIEALGENDGFLFNLKMRDALEAWQTNPEIAERINEYGRQYNPSLHNPENLAPFWCSPDSA